MRSLLLIPLAAALVLASSAQAQAPLPVGGTPTYTVAVMNLPAEVTGLAANATVTTPFQVALSLNNVFCTAEVVIPVTVTAAATGAPSNIAFTVEPATLNFTIAQGPHAGTAAGGTQDANLVATVTGNITANGTVSIVLTADAPAPAGPPQGCQGAGPIPAATSTPGATNATLVATPQPPVEEPPAEDTPFVGVVAVAAVAVGVALARRRKD